MRRIVLTLGLVTCLVGAESSHGEGTDSESAGPTLPGTDTHDCQNLCGPLFQFDQFCHTADDYELRVEDRTCYGCWNPPPELACPTGMSTEIPVCPEGEQVYGYGGCYMCAQPCVGPFVHEFEYDGDGHGVPLVTASPIVHLESGTPNPFRWETRIAYSLTGGESARLTVYDITGRMVTELPAGARAGRHEVTWDGRDSSGETVGAGIYFVRLEAGSDTHTRKIVFAR